MWRGHTQSLQHANQRAERLAATATRAMTHRPIAAAQDVLNDLNPVLGIGGPAELTVTDLKGNVLATATAGRIEPGQQPDPTAESASDSSAWPLSERDDVRTVQHTEAIFRLGDPVARLHAVVPVRRSGMFVGQLLWILVPAVLVIGLAPWVVFIAWFRRWRRRGTHLATAVDDFVAGRAADPLASGDPLFGDLEHTLNEVARRVRIRIQRLEGQREEFKTILESMSSGMIVVDLDHRILHVNRAAERMFHIDEDMVRGRLLEETLRDPSLHRFVDQAVGSEETQIDEITIQQPREATIQVLGEPMRPTGAEPTGLLLLLDDVTELRRLERIRSDFAANVSHELRTPITSIQGYVETLLEIGEEQNDQPTRGFLEVIQRNTERLAAIIDDLLALSALERVGPREKLECQPTVLADVARSAVNQIRDVADRQSITIQTDFEEDLQAPANWRLLEQALGNLLSNAVKYSPPETTVTISTRHVDQGRVVISVADEGPGIAEQHLPRLFERFYRVDQARSRELGGTGLGLAIVKHICLAHGGSVDVKSEPGRGSVFRMFLPARTNSHASPGVTRITAAGGTAGSDEATTPEPPDQNASN